MKEEIRKELEDIAPRLALIQRPDDVPPVGETYFHNVQVEALQTYREHRASMPGKSAADGWWSFLSLPRRPAMAIAFASVCMLVVSVFWLWPETPQENAFAELKTEEIYSYIEENIDDFEIELLMHSGLTSQRTLFQGLEQDGLEDYILDEIQEWDEDDWNDIL